MSLNHHEADRPVPVGPLQLRFKERTCTLPSGETIQLTPREIQILSRLSTEQYRTAKSIATSVAIQLYPDAIENTAIEPASLVSEETILVYIFSLRKKLGDKSIESKIGFGYRLSSGG